MARAPYDPSMALKIYEAAMAQLCHENGGEFTVLLRDPPLPGPFVLHCKKTGSRVVFTLERVSPRGGH